MFEQTFVEGTAKTNKSWTVMASFIFQMVLLAVGIIIPLIWVDQLPSTQLTSFLVAPPPPPPPPPPPAPAVPVKVQKVVPRQFDMNKLMAPKVIPKEIADIKEDLAPPPASGGVPGGVPGGVAGGTAGGVLGGIIGGIPSAAPPPPKVTEPPKPPTPKSIRVGGQVMAAKLVRQTRPSYPPLAKQARIQGTVLLNAIIDKDGTIKNLNVISGHPLLTNSALEAVKTWQYQPTLLNGDPVEVVTQISVNFTLSQ